MSLIDICVFVKYFVDWECNEVCSNVHGFVLCYLHFVTSSQNSKKKGNKL